MQFDFKSQVDSFSSDTGTGRIILPLTPSRAGLTQARAEAIRKVMIKHGKRLLLPRWLTWHPVPSAGTMRTAYQCVPLLL